MACSCASPAKKAERAAKQAAQRAARLAAREQRIAATKVKSNASVQT